MKDFDFWNNKKKNIEIKGENKFYHPRDVWWCSLGLNIGFEQDGKDKDFQRLVLIISGLSKEVCIIVPLTTSEKNHKYRINVGFIAGKKAKAIISQIKVVDTKRLVNKISVLDQKIFEKIRKSVRDLI